MWSLQHDTNTTCALVQLQLIDPNNKLISMHHVMSFIVAVLLFTSFCGSFNGLESSMNRNVQFKMGIVLGK